RWDKHRYACSDKQHFHQRSGGGDVSKLRPGRWHHTAKVLGFRDTDRHETLRAGQLEWRAGRHQRRVLMNTRSLSKVNPHCESGVSLLEALITIVVLAFGILGLAGLQSKMQTVEVESYARSQALVLLDDMAARLSAHRGVAATYVTASPVGTGDTQSADCSGTVLGLERDTCEWS